MAVNLCMFLSHPAPQFIFSNESKLFSCFFRQGEVVLRALIGSHVQPPTAFCRVYEKCCRYLDYGRKRSHDCKTILHKMMADFVNCSIFLLHLHLHLHLTTISIRNLFQSIIIFLKFPNHVWPHWRVYATWCWRFARYHSTHQTFAQSESITYLMSITLNKSAFPLTFLLLGLRTSFIGSLYARGRPNQWPLTVGLGWWHWRTCDFTPRILSGLSIFWSPSTRRECDSFYTAETTGSIGYGAHDFLGHVAVRTVVVCTNWKHPGHKSPAPVANWGYPGYKPATTFANWRYLECKSVTPSSSFPSPEWYQIASRGAEWQASHPRQRCFPVFTVLRVFVERFWLALRWRAIWGDQNT